MKRFKTKQECASLNPPATLVYYGEPCNSRDAFYRPEAYTTAPHPYEGKSFKIKVTPKESEKVQKKAFALGYSWYMGHIVLRVHEYGIFVYKDKHMDSCSTENYFAHHDSIELTPQQFLDGDLPSEPAIDPNILQGRIDELKKPDAYITEDNRIIFWDGEKVDACKDATLAWTYNLMQEGAFRSKHPDKLKFKEWEVTLGPKDIKIGCEWFDKKDILRWYERSKVIRSFIVTLDDAYMFINDNKKRLGL